MAAVSLPSLVLGRKIKKFVASFVKNVVWGRAGGRTPRTPRPGGGLMLLRGLMLRMEKFFLYFFNVFKIFLKIFVHNEIYR